MMRLHRFVIICLLSAVFWTLTCGAGAVPRASHVVLTWSPSHFFSGTKGGSGDPERRMLGEAIRAQREHLEITQEDLQNIAQMIAWHDDRLVKFWRENKEKVFTWEPLGYPDEDPIHDRLTDPYLVAKIERGEDTEFTRKEIDLLAYTMRSTPKQRQRLLDLADAAIKAELPDTLRRLASGAKDLNLEELMKQIQANMASGAPQASMEGLHVAIDVALAPALLSIYTASPSASEEVSQDIL
jgi:hypothetical protein